MSNKNRIRLFLDNPLSIGNKVSCTAEQMHYLLNVMRRQKGDEVYLFNGRDGEFLATVSTIGKKECSLQIENKFCDFYAAPDIWLLFAPLKKDNTDFVVAKATELGVSKILPVKTEYTSVAKVRTERLKAQVIESSEQSRRQDVPIVEELTDLYTLLQNWQEERKLIFCDESGQGKSVSTVMADCRVPAALLVGPEGGFSQKELEFLRKMPYTRGVSLGKRILRAETAVAAAISCWQALCGDWID